MTPPVQSTPAPARRLLAAGTYDLDAHPRFRVVLEGLRARGWQVDEVVAPLGMSTAERVDVLRRPSRLPRLAVAIARAWRTLVPALVRRRRTGPRPDAVLVGYLGHFDAPLVRALTRPRPLVLDYLISGAGTATDRGAGGGLKDTALRLLDDVALRAADVVVVDTPEHAAALPARHRDRAVVVPVGADGRWFAAREAAAPRDPGARLSVVFYGLLTPLQGAPVIAEALRLLDGAVDATVVGTGQDEDEVDRLLAGVPHVTRRAWVPADELPALVAAHDVCLGIVGTGDKARRVVPNKAYQGAAAGCVVVTGDTGPQRRAFGDDAVLVPPGDAAALAAALRALADDPARVAALAERSSRRADADFSARGVVRDLAAAIEERA